MRRIAAAIILIASLLSFLMACPILAGPVEDSKEAYRRGDYKTAYQLIKPQAEKGDAGAQFILGFMYDEGKGVPQDYVEAAKWYRKAAEQGNKAAQHNLSLMMTKTKFGWTAPRCRSGIERLQNRETVPPSPTAVSWITKARFRRTAPICRSGIEGRQDRKPPPSPTAISWITKASSKDRADMEKWHRRAAGPETAAAPSNVGLMDNQGQVSKDRAEMQKWHRRAAGPEPPPSPTAVSWITKARFRRTAPRCRSGIEGRQDRRPPPSLTSV